MLNRVLTGIARNGRIANAYLFAEGEAEAKLAAARAFAQAINETKKENHPDIIVIERLEDAETIKIEQVRELKDLTRYGPTQGKYQVVIIKDADLMRPETANSFLKLLEEPPPRVTFILLSERENTLPSTIRSRCQRIVFPEGKPSLEEGSREVYRTLTKKPFDYLANTQMLLDQTESKDLEKLLADLFVLYAEDRNTANARHILEALKGVKKWGNKKLICDYLGYKLWKEN